MSGRQDLLPSPSDTRTEQEGERSGTSAPHNARRAARTAVLAVAALIIGITLARAVFVAVHHSPPTGAPVLLHRAADWVSLGTTDLFVVPGDPLTSSLVNASVTACVWAAFAVLAIWAFQLNGGRRRSGANAGRAARTSQIPKPTRVIFAVVAVVSLLELAGFNGTYLLYSQYYVSTENASVDGDKIEINAPVSGVITNWAINQGSQLSGNQIVGRIKPIGAGAQPMHTVRAPGVGAVAVNDVVEGAYVEAGAHLATAYDRSRIYVTARVNEDSVEAVKPGAVVDLTVDSFPGVPMTGIVQVVQGSTASALTSSSVPGAADPSTPQTVIQYVPVKITLLDTGGHTLSPGMNVTAHIRK